MKQLYSIRLATELDSTSISALLKKSYGKSFQNYNKTLLREVLPLVTNANMALLKSSQYYVAEHVSGDLVGCGGWSFLNPETQTSQHGLVHVRHFATDRALEGNGIGGKILETCLLDAQGQQARAVECFSSLNAVGFYEKNGFKKIRPIDVHITDIITFPTMLMGKDL